MTTEFLGAGWSKGFRYHASLYRVNEEGTIFYRLNIEDSLTSRFCKRLFDDKKKAEDELTYILFGDCIAMAHDWR